MLKDFIDNAQALDIDKSPVESRKNMEYIPLVSIIIPVYNGSNYLDRAINSALSQVYPNCEVIVVNDGSNDNGATERIAKSYGDKVIYYRKPNGGVSSALNYGISKMKGEYFSWLSHDDEYTPSKISMQIEALTSTGKENCLVYSNVEMIDKDSKPLIIQRFKRMNRKILSADKVNTWDVVMNGMLRYGILNGCSFLIPRSVFRECGMFDEKLRYNQDEVMWYRIFRKKYNLLFIDSIGVRSRVHENQLTQTGRDIMNHDFILSSKELIPIFLSYSTKDRNFIYLYGLRNALYGQRSIVNHIIHASQEKKLLSKYQLCCINVTQLYGSIRPIIRRLYHRVFNRIATQ